MLSGISMLCGRTVALKQSYAIREFGYPNKDKV